MTTGRLKIYNAALTLCGETHLASLTEDREPRHLLDAVWDNDGVETCLQEAQWKHAMRTVRMDYETSIEPDFGFPRAFAKPTDWILTSAICEDENFNTPLTRYVEEAGYFYCALDTIYARYVSNSTSYGLDFSLWPPKFTRYVEAYFASKILLKLTSDSQKLETMYKRNGILDKARREAKSSDAMAGPTQFLPTGSWLGSRSGRFRRDRGSSTNLIG